MGIAEGLSKGKPDNPGSRLWLALALYRVGRYAEALRLLEAWWQRERELPFVVARVGQFFLIGRSAVLLEYGQSVTIENDIRPIAFLAMTHYRLGNLERARAALNDLRRMGEATKSNMIERTAWKFFDSYKNLLREAETLIEGQPQPGK